MNLDKLKESARKYEQNGQWRQAIDVYKKALREFEESGEGVLDPSLYNRIGDLEMRVNDTSAAIRAYEQAADLYTEQGFFNNAIALCSKILRVNPGRTATYLRLAQLNARKNFVGDARKNLTEYIERMTALHHPGEAVAAVRIFIAQCAENPEIRSMLVELLRGGSFDPSMREPFDQMVQELEQQDAPEEEEAGGEVSVDSDAARRIDAASGLVFLDLDGGQGRESAYVNPVEGLEVIHNDSEPEEPWRQDTGRVEGFEYTGLDPVDTEIGATVEFVTESAFDIAETLELGEEDPDPLDIDSYPSVELDEALAAVGGDSEIESLDEIALTPTAGLEVLDPIDLETTPDIELPLDEAQGFVLEGEVAVDADGSPETPADLVFLSEDDSVSTPGAQAPGGGEAELIDGGLAAAEAEPESADLARYAEDRARVLLSAGDRVAGIAGLEEALRQYEGSGRLAEALQLADELIRYEPDAIYRYQKRVEIAYRAGDRGAMLDSYLGLADALARSGGVEHAMTVYRRVLEHDPDNRAARSALIRLEAALAPPPPPPPPAPSFVDLGSLILDEPAVRDTRMRVDQGAPIENEDEAFHEALTQFKRGIEENIDAEDFQAHYDLGIAFKEMGLLDEAIAQFQKALRSPDGRLKTSEQLGIAFYDKSRFAIAEAVLRRAIESLPGGDEEKIGSIYWLARALEAQRRYEEALRYYERALAVDIRFLDVGDRVHRLTSGAS
ncbi:MAG: tetratricopeptide repeat protein [Gemmatimonadales bacterium]|nr:tetratricopeptide repeat protein [Gemmatimonadales bacterium]